MDCFLRNKTCSHSIIDYSVNEFIWYQCCFFLTSDIWTNATTFLLIVIFSLLHCLYLCWLHLSCISVFLLLFFFPPVSLFWRTALENVCYTSLYQRPLLQLYECNENQHTQTHHNGICESKQGWKMAEMLTLTFLLYKIYILCFCFFVVFFFNLKLTLYITVKFCLSVLSLL